jgi:hypothetical protein
MPDSTSLPETEHFEINEAAYRRLLSRAADEVIRCLLATESPTDLTMKKVRARARVFAACSTAPWVRATGVIRPKEGVRGIPSSVVRKEHYRLLRALRDRLLDTLLRKEREVWKKARRRMVNQAEHAVFRVTESAVHLHRLTPN